MRKQTDYIKRGAVEVIAQDVLEVKTASYDCDWNEEVILVKREVGVTTVGINLGTPVGYSGRRLLVKNAESATGAITLTAPVVTLDDGTTYQSKIDGANSVQVTTAYGSVEVISDGENFSVIG